MNKRILFIASQPFFEKRGSPIRLGFDLLALSQLGYDVEFLTLPIGERRTVEGVKIVRAPNPFFARKISIGPSPLKLAFDFFLFWMALWRVIFRRYAVVHGVEDCGIIALVCGRIGRARVVFERHSDPASYGGSRGLKSKLAHIYAKVERFTMRHADAVIGTGPGLVEDAMRHGRASRACLIPDIPSSLAEADPDEIAAARTLHSRAPTDILIGYVGSFAAYQGIDLIFSAIPQVVAKEPRARFVIIGGSDREVADRRAQLAKAGCLDAVDFAGFIDPDALPAHLSSFDILLSPRLTGMNTPLKLLDYLKAGVAIAATDTPANRLILDEKTAELSKPDSESFAGAILRLCANPARREALTAWGKTILEDRHNFAFFRDGLRQCYEYILTK